MSASPDRTTLAGRPSLSVLPEGDPRIAIVVLHGWAMTPEDLEPFARSLGVPAAFYLPEGPVEVPGGGRAWWAVDEERRSAALAVGPRDLAFEAPPGAPSARRLLRSIVAEVRARHRDPRVVLAGFSQGGMLACDAVIRGDVDASALALLSSSRITAAEWQRGATRLRDLPVLVSHGRADPDLSFAAGEALRDLLLAAGARVTWQPFDGGHEIPLPVWRALKRFVRELGPDLT